MLASQIIPQSLELNGGFVLPFRPKQGHHLAEDHQVRIVQFSCAFGLGDRAADELRKAMRIGKSIHQEARQCIRRVQSEKAALCRGF